MTAEPAQTDIAALLCSRICHDLVSPVGAMANGMELLEEETDADMRAHALELLAASAAQASARLQFARLAFGAAGGLGAELSLEDAGEAARRLFAHLKADLDWRADKVTVGQDAARLLLNLVHMAGEALPRGGQVTALCGRDGGRVTIEVTASGGRVYLRPDHVQVLTEGGGDGLDARLIQPWFAHALAVRHGGKVEVDRGEERLRFCVILEAGEPVSV